MKLRTKLLFGVGLLLFAMVVIMYLLPTIFVRKDVYKAADEIHGLFVFEQNQLLHSQQLWLEDAFARNKENLDAILLMLNEMPNYLQELHFNEKNPDKNVWIGLARTVSYDPSIGFVQSHNPELNKTAAIVPTAANLYPINKLSKQESFTWISFVHTNEGGEKKSDYFGFPLPEAMQKEKDYKLYVLLDPKKFESHSNLTPEVVEKGLETATDQLVPLGGILQTTQSVYSWAIKMNMIRALTPFYVEGLTLEKGSLNLVPEGLARIDSTGNGYVILSEEVFSKEPLFDDELYYKQHQPSSDSASIATSSTIVMQSQKDHAFISNTLLSENTYVSIGAPLDFLAKQLALSSNRIVLLNVNHHFWLGFDGEGNKLSTETIHQIVNTGVLGQRSGKLELNKQTYFFTQLTSLANDTLVFFDFRPLEGEQSIVSTLLALEDKLSARISTQLSLISIGVMILVLLFIGRIMFTIIYPVTKLADATQEVVAGRFEEVTLPDVGNRKDEVAILTRSFGDMVKGLQEREKIRGVLDKVVSKDVADEILKTHIHLGGEDRIVSMLFCDIRSFAAITASFTPQKTIQILNACMTKVSRVIEGEGGVIDKYVGDEVMAIFGAPTSHPDHALRAVSAGVLIIETLKQWNLARIAANEPPIEMGIGIHTGLVVAGNMGAEDRLNYTVLGANVNLAARICEIAKPNQLIISEATLLRPKVQDAFYADPLAPIIFKGFSEPMNIFEVKGFKWEV